jgi:hypothetical protein
MAKVNDLKKGLGSLKKKPIITEEKSENIVSKVHSKSTTKEAPKKRGRKKVNIEKTTRYTIDIPDSVYKAIKHKVVDDGGTMKSFIMRTLKKELNIK